MTTACVQGGLGLPSGHKKALALLPSCDLLEALAPKEAQIGQIQAPGWQLLRAKGALMVIGPCICEPWSQHLPTKHIPPHKDLHRGLTHTCAHPTPSAHLCQV